MEIGKNMGILLKDFNMRRMIEENTNTVENLTKIFNEFLSGKPELDYVDKVRWDALMKHFKGGKFLDIGILRSPLCVEAKKNFPEAEVWGMDFFPAIIQHFRPKYPEVNYVLSDCRDTPFRDGYFDYIVAGEVIEHLEEPQKLLDEVFRVLKKGGVFALTTPFEEKENELGGGQHIWSFKAEDIIGMLEQYGRVEASTEIIGRHLLVHCFYGQ